MTEQAVAEQATNAWKLGVGYDYRFGLLMIRVTDAQGKQADFPVNMVDLLRSLKVHPEEFAAYLAEAAKSDEQVGLQDIEPVRHRVLEETDWTNKVVLDIGGFSGFAAQIAHKGGAKRAICLDSHQFGHYADNDPGHWIEERLEGVEYITGDGFEWTEPVDIIIAFNIMYHVKGQWQFLEHLRSIAKEQMLLCSLVRWSNLPTFYLYEAKECNKGDDSVFWGPSVLGLERLLKFTGWDFKQEGLAMDRAVWRCFPTRKPEFRQSRY